MSTLMEVIVPDIGDFSDVEIIEVLVTSGEAVAAEDPLITLESDKATMDVPSPANGKVVDLKVGVGDRVSEGSVILTLDTDEAGTEQTEPVSTDAEPKADVAANDRSGANAAPQPSTPPLTEAAVGDDEDAAPLQEPRRPPPSLPPPVERSGGAPPYASPSVRRFARELGADLSMVRGSGAKGRILKEDVKQFVKERLARPETAGAAPTGSGIPPIPEIDFSKFGPVAREELPRIKKISGAHLHRAWLNVPHVTHHDAADITDLEAFRQSLKSEAEKRGVRVTLLAFLLKVVAAGLTAYPRFNASLSPDAQALIVKKYIHLGIAVDTPHGLVVPVIRDVDKKGVWALAEEMGEISARAREGKLSPTEMQGGCMSISSLGGIGGRSFTPVVNAPEVAILGVTRSSIEPVWNGSEFEPRLMLPLDLSYDHRVIDGAEAARFTRFLCETLGDARRLLL